MANAADLILASASPRRLELLERVGLTIEVVAPDVDESPLPDEAPGDYVRRVAAAKCDKVADAAARDAAPPSPPVTGPVVQPILGADTTVLVDGSILGKPEDEAAARAMLLRLAGRRHEVLTAYTVRFGDRRVERAVTTTVAIRALQPGEIGAYLASGEWRGKAGGYALQGIAAAFVTEVRGSVTNVIGLPLAEVLADLQALGALPRYPPTAFGAKSGQNAEQ